MCDQESAIADFLQILEEHRKNCEQQGKYVEAEIAKNRLDELKAHEENRRREAMKARQIAERLGVEEAHMLEFQQFNKTWDKKNADYEKQSEGLTVNMKERHTAEFQEFQKKLLLKQQQRPKFSTELLNLRKIEEHLAKAKDYNEAHKMKTRADALEAVELKRCSKIRQREMAQQEEKFKFSKEQEIENLKKRIESGRKEQRKKRQVELERMLQRYQNVKNELDAQQNLERMRADRQFHSGPSSKATQNVCRTKHRKGQPRQKPGTVQPKTKSGRH
mmetsp:Transcript_29771/g.43681  ORF Transcript_29771/g.43681 Transcript_29771/m.43681 type:complete len:276 (-) Transcript_29771:210-1037(-)